MTMYGRDLRGWLKRNKMHRKTLADELGLTSGLAVKYYTSGYAKDRPLRRMMRLALAAIEHGLEPAKK